MNENGLYFNREDYLDFLCANYYDVRQFCLDYDLILPMSEDLGFIRDYLDDNLLEVLECLFGWKNLRQMESVMKKYETYEKNFKRKR